MSEWAKAGLQLIGLAVAAALGYGIASTSVNKLNEQIFEATVELGRIKEKLITLDKQRSDTEVKINDTMQKIAEASNLNNADAINRVVEAVKVLSNNPNVAQLFESIRKTTFTLQCNSVVVSGSSEATCQEGFLVTGCSSGSNHGSHSFDDNSGRTCRRQAGTDWTIARCCRVVKLQ